MNAIRATGLLVVLTGVLLMASCRNETKSVPKKRFAAAGDTSDLFLHKSIPTHAQGFIVEYHPTFKKVKVVDPSDSTIVFGTYILAERGKSFSATTTDIVVEIPLTSVASVSTTHLAFLGHLNVLDALTGFSGMKYVQHKDVLSRYKKGLIKEIGRETDLNKEKIFELAPEILMVYPYEGMDYSWAQKAGIPVVYNSDYLELTPLGKAEWIKFFALFFNEEEKANEWFKKVENEYIALIKQADHSGDSPTVFSGKAYNGEWHVPGGKSFAARLLVDAGGNYLWRDDAHNNSLTCNMEVVMDKAMNAEWWVIVGACNDDFNLEQLRKEDPRYAEFDAFKNGKVIFCNTNKCDYFGAAVAEPQVLLKDLLSFFQPKIVSGHTPVYFQQLK
ncbi:MAG TPA: ABC transporter substrate-binding protein [Flavobacteriales bacterium]|nr:ABC transporter substrate-binding protein [Flavobacteriales bacterium]HRE97938.1 ABC transporter substrate-binding protein [Flavobacteriales bacterium]HRJ37780.1 ABC transporter substrate-binding protein [Flavobacteriales bacterium]